MSVNINSSFKKNFQLSQKGRATPAIIAGLQKSLRMATGAQYSPAEIRSVLIDIHQNPVLAQAIVNLRAMTHPGKQQPYEKASRKLFARFAKKYDCKWEFFTTGEGIYLHHGRIVTTQPDYISKSIDGLVTTPNNHKFAVMFKADNGHGGSQMSQINEVQQLFKHAGSVQDGKIGYILGLGGSHVRNIDTYDPLNEDIRVLRSDDISDVEDLFASLSIRIRK